MIKKLSIKNFKSIKSLEIDCKKINILIGQPNVGKSNILEALGFFSWLSYYGSGSLNDFVRFERVSNLFYDESINETVEIVLDNNILNLRFRGIGFGGAASGGNQWQVNFSGDYNSLSVNSYSGSPGQGDVKLYRFAVLQSFSRLESAFILPPKGENLVSFLMSHKEIRAVANSIFTEYGFRLILKPQENRIEVRKSLEDVDISYPYSLVSDTLQRMVFYQSAILSNKQSVLIFEEPEAHAFPFYTKQMAEMIALDENNQYFISTHNPYFLGPVVEKAKKEDITVNIVYFEDYQTKVRPLLPEEIARTMEMDIFSNLDLFLKA